MSETLGNAGPAPGTAFSLGWLMAQLFGPLQRQSGSSSPFHLPTVAELDRNSRMELAFTQLDDLLQPYPGLSSAGPKNAWQANAHNGFDDQIRGLHLDILKSLVADGAQLSAYQTGRALSDTCQLPHADPANPQAQVESFLRQFNRFRLATLQSWLAQADSALPSRAAATVSRSLTSWQDWVDANVSVLQGNWEKHRQPVATSLHAQATAWHALLAGHTDASGQASPQAWIQAGQSILRTIQAGARTAVRRFWPVLLVVAAAVGGLLYLAIANTEGTQKVWSSLVTVAAGLGITGAGLRAAAKRAVGGLGDEISQAAKLDAQAWAATWLPATTQGPIRRIRLASQGVAIPRAGKRVDKQAPELPQPTPPAPPVSPPPSPTEADVPAAVTTG